jgi:hypothetical protein
VASIFLGHSLSQNSIEGGAGGHLRTVNTYKNIALGFRAIADANENAVAALISGQGLFTKTNMLLRGLAQKRVVQLGASHFIALGSKPNKK